MIEFFPLIVFDNIMKSLKDISATVTAKEIEKNPEEFIEALKSEPHDYLKQIFSNLGYLALNKFLKSGLYDQVIDSNIVNGTVNLISNLE